MTSKDHQQATEAQALGYAAFRAGDFARARDCFERASAFFETFGGVSDPDALTALSDAGAACSALGDHHASLKVHEAVLQRRLAALGSLHHDIGVSLHNLGAVHTSLGNLDAAERHHAEAAVVWRRTLGPDHPFVARALASLASLALQRGHTGAAVGHAQQVLAIRARALPPNDPAIIAAQDALATSLMRAGDFAGACSQWGAALATAGGRDRPLSARLHTKRGTAQRRLGNLADAAASFSAAIMADGTLTAAHHHLAAILTRMGRETEAEPHRNRALRDTNVFMDGGNPEAPAVLVLSIADDGNIPLDTILPEHAFRRIWWFIDHARDPGTPVLPAYNVVFNAIGDPDLSGAADAKIAAFRPMADAPFLNEPERVAATRRDRLPALLHGIDGLAVPRTLRLSAPLSAQALRRAAEDASLNLPLLLRPAGAHGGKGVLRFDTWDALNAHAPDEVALRGGRDCYLAALHDCRSPDGYFRKYRVIFIDRVPYAYHLAISPDWLVHYYTSDMEAHAWKLAEEAAFLNNPQAAVGERAWAAVTHAGRRLDLDYCGMDFAVEPDGTVFVFEANATMLVHLEHPGGPLASKNPFVQRIADAFQTFIASRLPVQRGRTSGQDGSRNYSPGA